MTKIVINNNEFDVLSFNRNTYVNEDQVFSNASIIFAANDTPVSNLHALVGNSITSLKLKKNDEIIYDAGEINATITSLNESLMGDEININANIEF